MNGISQRQLLQWCSLTITRLLELNQMDIEHSLLLDNLQRIESQNSSSELATPMDEICTLELSPETTLGWTVKSQIKITVGVFTSESGEEDTITMMEHRLEIRIAQMKVRWL